MAFGDAPAVQTDAPLDATPRGSLVETIHTHAPERSTMSEEDETLRAAAEAASAESDEESAAIVAAGYAGDDEEQPEATPEFTGMGAGDVGGAVVPPVEEASEVGAAAVEDTGITADAEEDDTTEVEAAVEAGEITDEAEVFPDEDDEEEITLIESVFLLTSATYGQSGQGTHVVGVFSSKEAAEEYQNNATPPVADGVIAEYGIE